MQNFKQLCEPAKLYFILVIISIIIGLFSGFQVLAIIIKLIFAVIWTFVLNWFCKKGWSTLSWILVIFPFVLMVVVYLGLMKMSKGQNSVMSLMQLNSSK